MFSGGTGDTYSTWGGQADNGSENTVYGYNDDVTWVKGRHTFKFGGMFQINHYNGFGRQCEFNRFTGPSTFTSSPAPDGTNYTEETVTVRTTDSSDPGVTAVQPDGLPR